MEKQNDLFQELTQEERLEALKQMATKTDEEPIRRVFTHDERSQMKDSLAEDSIALREKKKEFAVIKKEFDKAAKVFAEQIGMACDDLKHGYTENNEPVFIGEPAKSIKIEISCEADNSAVKFWLESPDLIELTQKDTKTIIDTELKRVPESIVIIEQ